MQKPADFVRLCGLTIKFPNTLEHLLAVVQPLTHDDNLSNTPVFNNPSSCNQTFNSLLTEDLSDDVPVHSKPTKWYLLSEDESNTNFDAPSRNTNSCVGANLNQIFPLICAVPNLSTISEVSKESDSRKFVFESDFETISNCPSLLD